jgi:hypothetical protein
MWTFVIVLLICGRTSTLLSAVTVPVASRTMSTSRCCARTELTETGAPPAPEAAPDAAAALVAAPPGAASRPRMTRTPAATSTPMPITSPPITVAFFIRLSCLLAVAVAGPRSARMRRPAIHRLHRRGGVPHRNAGTAPGSPSTPPARTTMRHSETRTETPSRPARHLRILQRLASRVPPIDP